MSSLSAPSSPENLWNKFTKSTKSLSSSISQLAVKSESDGNSVETTLVHKALVKFYENQEPFQGFPGWLGHKEDLPDENKLLKKQMEHQEKLAKKNEQGSFGANLFSSNRNRNSYSNILNEPAGQTQEPTFKPTVPKIQQRPTASMSFQSIYNSNNDGANSRTNNQIKSAPIEKSAGSDTNLRQQSPHQHQHQPNQLDNAQPERSHSSSSIMMRERLKRQQSRNGFGF